MARRLADVCQLVGAPSVRAFREMLVHAGGETDGFPKYAAVLTYHGEPYRDPPSVYLARILEVFPIISAEWLLAGRGEATRSPRSPYEAFGDAVTEAFRETVGGYVPEGGYVSPTVLTLVQHLEAGMHLEWANSGAALAHGTDDAGQRRQANRGRELGEKLGRDLGQACAASAMVLACAKKGERIPMSMFSRFALRFLGAAGEMVPAWLDRQLTPAERRSRRRFTNWRGESVSSLPTEEG